MTPETSSDYLATRVLTRHAGRGSLWALAVSAVIVGEFSGWNQGLLEGGFGGLFIATILITLMYLCLCCSIAELGTAMPFTGGAYAYARTAFGVWGGLGAGLAQVIEYVLAIASNIVVIGTQVTNATREAFGVSVPGHLVWLATALIFVVLNTVDTRVFFRMALVLALASLAVLTMFWAAALPRFELTHLLAVEVDPGGTPWLPHGLAGIASAAPFAIWFYLAVEQVPMAAEESRRPERDIPAGMLWGLATLAAAALLTLFLNPGTSPGIETIGQENDPLLYGFRTVFGAVAVPGVLVLLTLVGSLASFHSGMYAAGRSIFCLSRAGYLPTVLSVTSRRRGTPVVAISVAAVASVALAEVVRYAPGDVPVQNMLIQTSVVGALISYAFQFLAYLKLRMRHPDLPRPYRSPLGPTGAVTGLLIASATAILLFQNPNSRIGMLICVLLASAAVAGFMLAGGRRRLQPAPEERFAETVAALPNTKERPA